MATAWAVMHKLGIDGYRRLTAVVIDAAQRIAAGVRDTPGLHVLGEPEAHLLAIAGAGVDVFAVGDAMHTRGWYLDRQQPPDSLHMTVSAGNAPVVDEFLQDLRASVDEVGAVETEDRSTNYATLE
jgi:glutamate/tyrosine decarboxylase-like PLP-dependent enzyme